MAEVVVVVVVVVGETEPVAVGEPPGEMAPVWAWATGQAMGRAAFITSYKKPVSSILPLPPLDIFIHEHLAYSHDTLIFYQYCQITMLDGLMFII